jgi:hypothetical protein
MKFLGSRKFKKINGINNLTVEVWSTSRGGTHSPIVFYLKYKGRWVSPYEMRLRWQHKDLLSWLMNLTLKALYSGPMLKDLIYEENPFLKLIPKNDGFAGKSFPVPLIYGK